MILYCLALITMIERAMKTALYNIPVKSTDSYSHLNFVFRSGVDIRFGCVCDNKQSRVSTLSLKVPVAMTHDISFDVFFNHFMFPDSFNLPPPPSTHNHATFPRRFPRILDRVFGMTIRITSLNWRCGKKCKKFLSNLGFLRPSKMDCEWTLFGGPLHSTSY